MFGRRNNRSAVLALLSAGGLWAWQNRDTIKGWVNQYSAQYAGGTLGSGTPSSAPQSSQPLPQYGTPPAATGETRRISPEEYDRIAPSDTTTPGENI